MNATIIGNKDRTRITMEVIRLPLQLHLGLLGGLQWRGRYTLELRVASLISHSYYAWLHILVCYILEGLHRCELLNDKLHNDGEGVQISNRSTLERIFSAIFEPFAMSHPSIVVPSNDSPHRQAWRRSMCLPSRTARDSPAVLAWSAPIGSTTPLPPAEL